MREQGRGDTPAAARADGADDGVVQISLSADLLVRFELLAHHDRQRLAALMGDEAVGSAEGQATSALRQVSSVAGMLPKWSRKESLRTVRASCGRSGLIAWKATPAGAGDVGIVASAVCRSGMTM
ncbi:hypothetical protein [Streptomyces sp. 3211]|uniref:hypothetical protein n=1 Tax=Streptomyces sp. 3211 TaxID=1964449 RepID=UPI0009A51E7A|nr:hypothetical protein [Streptomyces sp. 3211]